MKDASPEDLYDIFDLLWFQREEPAGFPVQNDSDIKIGQKVIAANKNQLIIGELVKNDSGVVTIDVPDAGEFEAMIITCQMVH